MLVVVWIVFVFTWGPHLIYHLLIARYPAYKLGVTGHQSTILVQTFGLMTMANSSMNPVLYAFMST